MRKLLTWIVVTLGIAALLRKLRGRRDSAEPLPVVEADPADELRRTLAETREDEMPVPGIPPGPEPAIDESATDDAGVEQVEASVEARRAAVYEQGRAAIDEMRRAGEETE